jgi:hypothetical protein
MVAVAGRVVEPADDAPPGLLGGHRVEPRAGVVEERVPDGLAGRVVPVNVRSS